VGIDVDSAMNLDFSPSGLDLDVGFGATAGTPERPIRYGGRLTPHGDTYRFGGGGGALSLDAPDALSGPRGLEVIPVGANDGTLILSAPNSYAGHTVVGDSRLISAVPGAVNPSSPIRLQAAGWL
jgi:hypothetical protein